MDKRNVGRRPEQTALALSGGGQTHFDQLCSSEHLFATWNKFARGKRAKADVLTFERRLEENIFELQSGLLSGAYRHGNYEPFIIHDPKRRQIHKASVRDRVVHQAVFDIIEPQFEKRFIYDSFSCRRGKGTHAGVKRLGQFLRQASHNNSQVAWVLKCDVKQFFASVNHNKLLNLLSSSVTDEKVMILLKEIIDSFNVIAGKGIPLGNVTSQLFANVYMHQLDWFVKHGLRENYYVRYCDDFVIAHPDRQHLMNLLGPIQEFLKDELYLQLHPAKIAIRKWSQGIDFLGYVLKPHCTLLRTKTKSRMLNRVTERNLTSYLGLCSHADSYELQAVIKTISASAKEC